MAFGTIVSRSNAEKMQPNTKTCDIQMMHESDIINENDE